MIHVHYEYDTGEGGYVDYIEPFPLGKGLTTKVIQSRQPLLLGTAKEQAASGAYIAPELLKKGTGVMSESTMMVPIIVSDKVLGVANGHQLQATCLQRKSPAPPANALRQHGRCHRERASL